MWSSSYGEIEELTLCSCCKRVFDDGDRAPKVLACKHHFCLSCARGALAGATDVYCMHCWKRTEIPAGRADTLPTHGPVLALARRLAGTLATAEPAACARHALTALWCMSCNTRACRACPEHAAHALLPPDRAREQLARDSRHLRADLSRLAARQRDLLLRALDAATALKLRLETELAAPPSPPPALSPLSLSAAAAERDLLRARHAEALVQNRLDDAVRGAVAPLDFEKLRHALTGLTPLDAPLSGTERRDPLLLLSNYCTALLFVRQAGAGAGETSSPSSADEAPVLSPLSLTPPTHPQYYFELDVNGTSFGRVVVEVRDDVAPRMARNFGALTTGELGVGYRGCSVFQCWENESVITGDFELNNGRGGRSAFEESYFMPDDTRIAATRGAVGMRRSQKRHDNLGLVGSQFRIVLREMRGFTAIFGHVIEGLELVDRLSRTGDSAGKPHSTIVISSCGKLN